MNDILPTQASIDQLLKEFDTSLSDGPKRTERRMLSIWVSEETGEKYARIQKKTGRRFHRLLKEVLTRVIDQVQIDEAG